VLKCPNKARVIDPSLLVTRCTIGIQTVAKVQEFHEIPDTRTYNMDECRVAKGKRADSEQVCCPAGVNFCVESIFVLLSSLNFF